MESQLLDGLSYLHKELARYHGALSCGEILLSLDGRVKIGEFFQKETAVADGLKPTSVNHTSRTKGSTRKANGMTSAASDQS